MDMYLKGPSNEEVDEFHILENKLCDLLHVTPSDLEAVAKGAYAAKKKGHGIGLHRYDILASDLGITITEEDRTQYRALMEVRNLARTYLDENLPGYTADIKLRSLKKNEANAE